MRGANVHVCTEYLLMCMKLISLDAIFQSLLVHSFLSYFVDDVIRPLDDPEAQFEGLGAEV